LLRLSTALFAAGVFTAFPEDAGVLGLGLVCVAPRLFPVVPWFRAFEVFGPGVPPVPLIVLPFESVLPAAPAAPVEPPGAPALVCAWANEQMPNNTVMAIARRVVLTGLLPVGGIWDIGLTGTLRHSGASRRPLVQVRRCWSVKAW
jgi:hypothetical protein